MKLTTQIPIKKQPFHQIDYYSKLFLLGSCFSENIGNLLSYYKFQNVQNPFGILFHPIAIEKLISNAINNKVYSESDVFKHNERWHCFDTHSELSTISKDEFILNINDAIQSTRKQLLNASHFIITLGTSWVYRFTEKDTIVANCHKIPQKKFSKELLSVDEVSESLDSICALIQTANPTASIIFTVSPVRHLKDGFIENQQSKSHLISAIHQIIDSRKNRHYFPSYEIMMDELRDYRFYKEDMIHPNQTAIRYIWEKFTDCWFSEDAFNTMNQVEVIQKGELHRPFNPNSEAHKKFLNQLAQKKETLLKAFPFIQF